MVDNLIKGVIVGVLIFVWYYAGTAVPWTGDGAREVGSNIGITYMVPGLGYLVWSFLAFALARSVK